MYNVLLSLDVNDRQDQKGHFRVARVQRVVRG